jgi:hypothetical protein
MQNSRYSYAHGGLSSLKEARDLLHKHAPKGEHLAYINPKEAALLKAHGGSGIMTLSGIRSYGFLKKITKPFAKILDKIVPNEIKPALPYLAAAVPFMLPAGFTIGGLGSALSRGLVSAAASATSQLSQEGAEKRGLNPFTTALSGISGYLSTPSAGMDLGSMKTAYVPESVMQGIDSASQVGIAGSPNITNAPLTIGEKAMNLGLNVGQTASDYLSKGTTAFEKMTGPEDITGKDLMTFGKAIAPSEAMAVSEQAYNKAQDALDEYNKKIGNIKNMTQEDLAERRKYVQQYMALAGFNQSDIDSALSRQGLMMGGRAAYEAGSNNEGVKTIPINLDAIAKQLFGDRLDNLTYTQKETVYNRYYDLKDKKAKGGLMSLGGNEMDFRAAGGFVPIGKKERADDVPARLSKNEFVFTAKAVRNAGHGDIKAGAKRMYQLMKHLEAR